MSTPQGSIGAIGYDSETPVGASAYPGTEMTSTSTLPPAPKALAAGDAAPPLLLPAHTGNTFDLAREARAKRTLVVFFRFAGCPFCNVHVHVLIERYAELERAGVRVVGVFGSPLEAIRERVAQQAPPFPLLADADDAAHIAWGATHESALGMMDPRNMSVGLAPVRQRATISLGRTDGKLLRMPADFVLDENLRVAVAHYGRYAADHLSVDDVITPR
jgi:peroxiredoxin